jgi:hypothetical protein
MTKEDLAAALRRRLAGENQWNKRIITDEEIALDWADDDKLVRSYIVCPGCGHDTITQEQLQDCIGKAVDAMHFLDLTEELTSFTCGGHPGEDKKNKRMIVVKSCLKDLGYYLVNGKLMKRYKALEIAYEKGTRVDWQIVPEEEMVAAIRKEQGQ